MPLFVPRDGGQYDAAEDPNIEGCILRQDQQEDDQHVDLSGAADAVGVIELL